MASIESVDLEALRKRKLKLLFVLGKTILTKADQAQAKAHNVQN